MLYPLARMMWVDSLEDLGGIVTKYAIYAPNKTVTYHKQHVRVTSKLSFSQLLTYPIISKIQKVSKNKIILLSKIVKNYQKNYNISSLIQSSINYSFNIISELQYYKLFTFRIISEDIKDYIEVDTDSLEDIDLINLINVLPLRS
jgi:hypothetical protein